MPDVWDRLHDLVAPPIELFCPTTHVYTHGGVEVPSVTQVLKEEGLGVDYGWIQENRPHVLDNARERGEVFDLAANLLDADNLDLDSVDPIIQGYLLSYQLFRAKYCPTFLEIQQWHIYELNGFKYGGTPDRIAVMPDGEWILDLKATAKIDKSYGLQTAAYDPTRTRRRGAVHCFKDGKEAKLWPYEDANDYLDWEAALRIWHRKHKRK